MILAADMKNTSVILGCIDKGEISQVFTIAADLRKTEIEYAVHIKGILDFYSLGTRVFTGAIMSSVVPSLTPVIREALRLVTGKKPLVIGSGVKTGLNILIDNPAQLGSDLVASSVGALAAYKPPMIIVDFATATTLFALDAKGSYLGGAIAPGLELSVKSLRSIGSLLTEVTIEAPRHCIGTNTDEGMKSGAVFGTAALTDGMIGRMEEEMGVTAASLIATGTYARIIIPHCKRSLILDETLTLRGLGVIYSKNMRPRQDRSL